MLNRYKSDGQTRPFALLLDLDFVLQVNFIQKGGRMMNYLKKKKSIFLAALMSLACVASTVPIYAAEEAVAENEAEETVV